MKPSLSVDTAEVVATQAFLRQQASRPPYGHEGVALWLGRPEDGAVSAVMIPEQVTDFDFFDVPLGERQRIASYLAATRRVVLCQVHSHPNRAWHSEVDDRLALPRHVGALSLVVPDQGRRPSILDGAALYELMTDGEWVSRPLDCIRVSGST